MSDTENIRDVPKEGSTSMFKLAVGYTLYAVSMLASLGFSTLN